jgi:hypothetical protein
MKKRNVALAAAAVFILLTALALGYRWFSRQPDLTVYLRCEGNVSGKLSAARILPNGESGKPESFELETACKIGKINIGEYRREEKIQFTFERENGETNRMISEYDEHIQSDQNGFFAVLKLMPTPPFIVKDSI